MPHLGLNTDTFSLSGQSTSVLVSCATLSTSWELPDSGSPGRQTKLCQEEHVDEWSSIHHVGPAGSSECKWELNTDWEEVNGQLRVPLPPTIQQAGPYPKSELRGLKQIT